MAKKKKPKAKSSKAKRGSAKKRPMAAAKRAKAKPAKKSKPATGGNKSPRPSSWLDEESNTPMIERQARRLGSFLDAMADGKVDDAEIAAQEARLVKLMKEVEPMLDGATHPKVTQLLCELTAYDLMQVLHSMELARPKTVFQG